MEPPLPETSFGNFSTGPTTEADIDLGKDEYCFEVADRIKDSVRYVAEQFKKLQNKDGIVNFFKGVMEKFSKQEEVVSFTVSSLNV
ncbi:hypothetical protein M5689_007881 [Euphorbia peplus]|nr:hypothetical protein M5689_007881 [Euphorbia peplus]